MTTAVLSTSKGIHNVAPLRMAKLEDFGNKHAAEIAEKVYLFQRNQFMRREPRLKLEEFELCAGVDGERISLNKIPAFCDGGQYADLFNSAVPMSQLKQFEKALDQAAIKGAGAAVSDPIFAEIRKEALSTIKTDGNRFTFHAARFKNRNMSKDKEGGDSRSL